MLKKLLLASTALVVATPSAAVALPPWTGPVISAPSITVPLPAVLQIPMPGPAAP